MSHDASFWGSHAGKRNKKVGTDNFAQFIRICRWLKLPYKEQLAPLENAPFSCNGLENDAEQPSVSASIDELQTAIN
jgi:hypothetical protein